MAVDYFHLAPVVLTDEMFFQYVPDVFYTGTYAQRRAAYLWSEQRFVEWAGCPIYPTTLTGTYTWPHGNATLPLRFSRVTSIDAVVVISEDGGCSCGLTRDDGCGIISDQQYGFVDLRVVSSYWVNHCGCGGRYPYQMEVAFTTGFATGTIANDTSLHMALALGAQIFLNEIVDPAANEGGAGDPGIKGVSNLGYSDTRQTYKASPWGHSARANMIAKSIPHLKRPNRPLALPSRRH